MKLVEFWLPGRPIVKKNTKRVYGSGKRKRVVYSSQYVFWEAVAMRAIAPVKFYTETTLEMHIDFFFKNRRAEPDLSNLIEGSQDMMKKAGKIKDDKQIHKIIARKFFYAEQEGVHITLYGLQREATELGQK
jgi:Holliday junction resolvase RusA-like endonuclease